MLLMVVPTMVTPCSVCGKHCMINVVVCCWLHMCVKLQIMMGETDFQLVICFYVYAAKRNVMKLYKINLKSSFKSANIQLSQLKSHISVQKTQ